MQFPTLLGHSLRYCMSGPFTQKNPLASTRQDEQIDAPQYNTCHNQVPLMKRSRVRNRRFRGFLHLVICYSLVNDPGLIGLLSRTLTSLGGQKVCRRCTARAKMNSEDNRFVYRAALSWALDSREMQFGSMNMRTIMVIPQGSR